ncbi:MAG TPA: helix-turn-helix domain-containing protein [Pyrinomonadaceae bacterium]|nr:helix-turn-helix domain-containing protein [Pyrinomonadaceae bacterium]
MRFVQLSEPELETLQQGHKNGSQFQFRNRCFCLILSSQGKTVPELAQFFDISRITIYSWFDAWETNGIGGLMNRKGQGRKPILSLQNPQQVAKVKSAVARNPQSVKSAVAELESALGLEMHPETLKRFLKNLVSASAASAPVLSQGKWQLREKRAKRH